MTTWDAGIRKLARELSALPKDERELRIEERLRSRLVPLLDAAENLLDDYRPFAGGGNPLMDELRKQLDP